MLFKRRFFGAILAIGLVESLLLVYSVRIARAGESIYIRADGSVEPASAPLQRLDDSYSLVDDVYNMTFVVERDNIVLDGENHLVEGSIDIACGIDLSMRRNVSVRNIRIKGFSCGIFFFQNRYSSISNCSVSDNVHYGIWVLGTGYSSIENNTLKNGGEAICMESSAYNHLLFNDLRRNKIGIDIDRSTCNTLRGNSMALNLRNFACYGWFLSDLLNDVDTSNTVDGKPIYYWVNRHNATVPPDAGAVTIVNSSAITVMNLLLRNNLIGVNLAFTKNSIVENVTTYDNYGGVSASYCESITISKCSVNNSEGFGIGIVRGGANRIVQNDVRYTNSSGIWLEDTNFNLVIGNNVSYSHHVFSAQEVDGSGILVDDSSRNNVTGNNLYRNAYGIGMGPTDSQQNRITKNILEENGIGLVLAMAQYNFIYHNNFINNGVQATNSWLGYSQPTYNTLDSGVFGGNYWSNYNGSDANHDGMGDVPYVVNQANIDHYPIMHRWRPCDVNCDGLVNVLDLIRIANAIGSKPNDPKWNPNADVREDEVINVLDLILVAVNLGT